MQANGTERRKKRIEIDRFGTARPANPYQQDPYCAKFPRPLGRREKNSHSLRYAGKILPLSLEEHTVKEGRANVETVLNTLRSITGLWREQNPDGKVLP